MANARGMEITRSRRRRWLRLALRAVYLVIGTLQSLLQVMLGVGVGFSTVGQFGEGPLSVATAVLALLLIAALFFTGLLTFVSSLQDWEPPHDRWQGIRWPIVGGAGTVIALASWIVIALIFVP